MSVTLNKIKTYEGGKSNIPGKKNIIKLSSNESPSIINADFQPSTLILFANSEVLTEAVLASSSITRFPLAYLEDRAVHNAKRRTFFVNL